MPAVNSAGKIITVPKLMPPEAWLADDGEQRDLGCGVEAQSEQKANRKHLPAARHHAEQWPEDASASKSATGKQHVKLVLGHGLAAARARESFARRRAG